MLDKAAEVEEVDRTTMTRRLFEAGGRFFSARRGEAKGETGDRCRREQGRFGGGSASIEVWRASRDSPKAAKSAVLELSKAEMEGSRVDRPVDDADPASFRKSSAEARRNSLAT